MTEHYYSRSQNVSSDPNHWDFTLKGNRFRFKTDNGVFSKKEVDFGSRVLIEAFSYPEVDGDILDVGCGYGPIGLSVAKEGKGRTIHMVDVNERALNLAQENAEINHIDNVLIYESDRLLQVKGNKFAAILTNPPIRAGKKVVHDIFEQSFEHLIHNGELWIVIQKKQGAPSALEKLEQLFQEVEVVEKQKGYFIIKAKRID
ncbi:class I SAM-dependent methyltransferase [Niallia taxi]|uniref:class I SAM-dependent methyltransferase n=1 Tax=Niallia taxi TaxID=2499688 RepID=UPI0012478260|nr:class I SAM-dependent methyltransferase [Niallia taxi]MCM3217999.1 class I SAM-dependent methyltransferase [Niallia taxi]MED4057074.1 class I SAM-dependent methyltransferase [Niallia taxi]MED4121545.1 class I SAM-dependent methyltransferase [Niallia taxi]